MSIEEDLGKGITEAINETLTEMFEDYSKRISELSNIVLEKKKKIQKEVTEEVGDSLSSELLELKRRKELEKQKCAQYYSKLIDKLASKYN
jgi:predicted RecB family endonuclease